MIHLFRRIRQKLIESGSATKYLFYAMGEILLVVIGILIALQVNNWNENRKNVRQVNTILMGVQEDLINDILEAERVINWYAERDSIINRMITNQYSDEDYRDPDNFLIYQAGLFWYPVALNNSSYETLTDNQEIIPQDYRDAVKRLNELYGQQSVMLNTGQDYLKEYIEDYRNFLFEEYEWAIDYQQDRQTDAVIDYFQNSSYHRRKLARFDQLNNLMVNSLQNIIDIATIEYLAIQDLTDRNDPLPEYYDDVEIVHDDLGQKLVADTYYAESQDLFVSFSTVNDRLILHFANSQSGLSQPILIDEIRSDTLSTRSRSFELVLNRTGEESAINSIEIVQNQQILFTAEKL